MRARKRVLFLERNLRNEKLGIMHISASLKARGHHADLIQTDMEDLHARINEYRPDFVAFSVTTGEHVEALKMARLVKKRFGIPNIFGGPHATFFPELGYEADVDFVVQGQGERAIVDIVEGRVAPGFLKAESANCLDDLPFADREIFYQYEQFRNNPMKNVITLRACPYRCSYCFNHSQLALTKMDGETRRWFDRRSIGNIVAEISRIRERYPLEKVLFIDDSFVQNRRWLDVFLSGYTQEVHLPWMCSLRVNCLDERLAERMFGSELEMVNYAIESADPDVQQRLLNRGRIHNGDVVRAIRLFNRFGVRARMQNMIGLPLANPLEDALNTLQFNMRHRVTDSWCSIYQPYPRTALGQYCIDHGFASADQLAHCSDSFFNESRLNIPDKGELYALQKLWYFIIEGTLPLDLVQILIRGRFTHEVGAQLQELRFHCSRRRLYGIDSTDSQRAADVPGCELEGTPRTFKPRPPAEAGSLIRRALTGRSVPGRFVDILAQVQFEPRQKACLAAYLRGAQAYDQPIYTLDDETGELADPNISIYSRGTEDPNTADIRKMPEGHFMGGMAEVCDALASRPASAPAVTV